MAVIKFLGRTPQVQSQSLLWNYASLAGFQALQLQGIKSNEQRSKFHMHWSHLRLTRIHARRKLFLKFVRYPKVLIIVWKPQENLEHRSNGRESEASKIPNAAKLSILAGLGQSHAAVPPIGHRRRLVSCDDVFTPWPFSCLVSLGGSFGVPTYSFS